MTINDFWYFDLVMDRTPFYQTSDELEHHLSNIERTWTCLSIDDRIWTPEFWLWTNGHRTSNLKGVQYIYKISHRTDRTSFFRTSNRLEHVHLLIIELEHPIFGFKSSNIEPQPIITLIAIAWNALYLDPKCDSKVTFYFEFGFQSEDIRVTAQMNCK